MEENDAESLSITNVDPELNQLLGLFDAPAFVRRGQELEYALGRLHARFQREREEQLEMVRVRLRQWSSVVTALAPEGEVFREPVASLWSLSGAETPTWADRPATRHRQRIVARDLVASLVRFNHRWRRFVEGFNLDPINGLIERYNRYYVFEKECCLGSSRLAARHFEPKVRLSADHLLELYPLLTVPGLNHDTR